MSVLPGSLSLGPDVALPTELPWEAGPPPPAFPPLPCVFVWLLKEDLLQELLGTHSKTRESQGEIHPNPQTLLQPPRQSRPRLPWGTSHDSQGAMQSRSPSRNRAREALGHFLDTQ